MSKTSQQNDDKVIRALYKKCPFLHWGRLRFIGSVRVLSVLSFVGACIAAGLSLPQLSDINVHDILSNTTIVWSFLGFIIALLIANLIHYVFCPAIIKKFASLSDFYMHQITIKQCQLETYPDDEFDASLLHVSKQYIKDLSTKPCARWSSLAIFSISIVCLSVFAYNLYSVAVSKNYIAKRITFTVNFGYNKTEIPDKSLPILKNAANLIKESNGVVIVKGYSDNTGTPEYNQRLSIERANAIKKYLCLHEELCDTNISVVGYGQLSPVAPNSSEEDRRYNRRVEIEIISNKTKDN